MIFRRFPTAFTGDGRPVWRSQGEEELPRHIPAARFNRRALERTLARLRGLDRTGIHLRVGRTRAETIELGIGIVGEIAAAIHLL